MNEMRRMYSQGMTTKEIAEHIGYSESYVRQIIRENRNIFPYRKRRIPKEIKEECVSLVLDKDWSQEAASRKYGVHVNTVGRWVSKELRRRIEERKCLNQSG